MNDRQAKYIIAIAEEGSISKAADKLFITQPSLSQVLINIEKKYGLKLFSRSSHSMLLTEAGEKFVDSMREMIQIERRLEQHLQEISNEFVGKIIVGISANKGLYVLPAVLPKFRQKFPKMDVKVFEEVSSVLEDSLLKKRIDLAVMNYQYIHSQLEYVNLPEEEMLLVVPITHKLAEQCWKSSKSSARPSVVSLKQIANEPFIYLSPNHSARSMVESMFQSVGVRPPKVFETANSPTAYALVAAGVGITILPDNFIRYMVPNMIPKKNCIHLHISDAFYRRKLAVCYPKALSISRSMEYFITLTHDALLDMHKKYDNEYHAISID